MTKITQKHFVTHICKGVTYFYCTLFCLRFFSRLVLCPGVSLSGNGEQLLPLGSGGPGHTACEDEAGWLAVSWSGRWEPRSQPCFPAASKSSPSPASGAPHARQDGDREVGHSPAPRPAQGKGLSSLHPRWLLLTAWPFRSAVPASTLADLPGLQVL